MTNGPLAGQEKDFLQHVDLAPIFTGYSGFSEVRVQWVAATHTVQGLVLSEISANLCGDLTGNLQPMTTELRLPPPCTSYLESIVSSRPPLIPLLLYFMAVSLDFPSRFLQAPMNVYKPHSSLQSPKLCPESIPCSEGYFCEPVQYRKS